MGIVTKTGDGGRTSLCCGTKVAKDDPRMEVCGALDEASSFLGMAKSRTKNVRTRAVAEHIQKGLIILNAEVTSSPCAVKRLKNRIGASSIALLEEEIACLEGRCGIRVRSFCLPGGNPVSAALDVARAITRRAERRCVTLMRKKLLRNRDIIVYLNRLSDLLYLLARSNEK